MKHVAHARDLQQQSDVESNFLMAGLTQAFVNCMQNKMVSLCFGIVLRVAVSDPGGCSV